MCIERIQSHKNKKQKWRHREIARERPREFVVPPPTLREMAADLGL